MPELRSGDFDATFMGDASTERFSPFYANSGFFYLKYNYHTRLFWQRVVTSMEMIYSSQSQQVSLLFIEGRRSISDTSAESRQLLSR